MGNVATVREMRIPFGTIFIQVCIAYFNRLRSCAWSLLGHFFGFIACAVRESMRLFFEHFSIF